jgi:hypothetical protein
LKRVAFHETRLLQELNFDIFVPIAIPKSLEDVNMSSSTAHGYLEDAAMLLSEIMCYAPEVLDLYHVDVLLHACYVVRSYQEYTSSDLFALYDVAHAYKRLVEEVIPWLGMLIAALTQSAGGAAQSLHWFRISPPLLPTPSIPAAAMSLSLELSLARPEAVAWRYHLPVLSATNRQIKVEQVDSMSRVLSKEFYEYPCHLLKASSDDQIYRITPAEGHRVQLEEKRRSQHDHALGCSWTSLAEIQVLGQLYIKRTNGVTEQPEFDLKDVSMVEGKNQCLLQFSLNSSLVVGTVAKMVNAWKSEQCMEYCNSLVIKMWCEEILRILHACSLR